MEASVCNLVEDGDRVMSCVNGVWGERFADMAARHGMYDCMHNDGTFIVC